MDKAFTVLIAEDELLVRTGLTSAIDWEKHNMKVVAQAGDGLSAWNAYCRYKPDILLTDLRMPEMDGLQLIQRIREEDDHCAVIVITCLEDFDALRSALRMNVSDYFIKTTMRLAEIEKTLEKVKTQVGTPRKADDETGRSNRKHDLLEKWIFNRNLDPKDFREQWDDAWAVHYPLALTWVHCESRRGFNTPLLNALAGVLSDVFHHPEIFPVPGDRFILLSEENGEPLEQICLRARNYMANSLNIQLKTVSMQGVRLENLPVKAKELMDITENGMICDSPALVVDADGRIMDSEYLRDLAAVQRFAALIPDGPRFQKCMHALYALSNCSKGEEMRAWMNQLEMNLNGETDTSFTGGIHARLNRLAASLAKDDTADRRRLYPAVQYVLSHLAENNMSLGIVSDAAHLHQQTFSLILKRVADMTYTDFLLRLRLWKAKELLMNEKHSLQQIAEESGFADIGYFCRLFKRETGATPGEWRKRGSEAFV